MPEYTQSSMTKMQQDAIQRVQEMNRRAKQTLERDEQFQRSREIESVQVPPIVEVQSEKPSRLSRTLRKSRIYRESFPSGLGSIPDQRVSEAEKKNGLAGILDIFSKDSERMILLLLLILLYSEKADMKLLMAIAYILL